MYVCMHVYVRMCVWMCVRPCGWGLQICHPPWVSLATGHVKTYNMEIRLVGQMTTEVGMLRGQVSYGGGYVVTGQVSYGKGIPDHGP